ncbi:MAG: TetR/AcrR family transcriptional regulator [Deltaproteobacteria bacterium]|nr:TetR/AcrR family transcriptional regulator [Deltaproteobacteria bacterium]
MRTTGTTTAGRARPRDPDATHHLILTAAQTMMAEQGPHGLTVSDVARRAGVNRGTAYQHFPTRERLVAAVIERVGRDTKQLLDATAPSGLDERIDATVEHFVGNPELVRLSLFRMLAGIPHPSTELWEGYVERVRALVASAGTSPDADGDMLAVILLGATMLWSLRVQSGGARAATTRRYLRELKRVMLHGVIRPEQHPDVVAALRDGNAPARAKRTGRKSLSRTTPAARRSGRGTGRNDIENVGAGAHARRGAAS